jgi:hypothetical protein
MPSKPPQANPAKDNNKKQETRNKKADKKSLRKGVQSLQ